MLFGGLAAVVYSSMIFSALLLRTLRSWLGNGIPESVNFISSLMIVFVWLLSYISINLDVAVFCIFSGCHHDVICWPFCLFVTIADGSLVRFSWVTVIRFQKNKKKFPNPRRQEKKTMDIFRSTIWWWVCQNRFRPVASSCFLFALSHPSQQF